ncbi:protein kinase [Lipomyces kononenkoae]
MAPFRRLRQVRHRQPSPPRRFSDVGCQLIGLDYLVEEETLPFYEDDQYYPVRIGEVFKSRYQVVGKLGYGAYSTAWLCRDLSEHKYAALKISTQLRKYPLKRRRELSVYEHLSKIRSSHPGQAYIRGLYDGFEISGPHGCHQCLVQPPMHMSILDMLESNPKPFNAPLLRMVLKCLLTALDFLHREAGIVHTGRNWKARVREKLKMTRERFYTSRSFRKPKNDDWGYPVLCDFGEARIGKEHQTGPMIQPHIYRAPEVTFEMIWGSPIDIWNLGALVWDLFEGEHLFHHLKDERGNYDPFKHMAQISGFLGLPPTDFILRSETTLQCFDIEGLWEAGEYAKIPTTSLEDVETRLEGTDKHQFLLFIRSMLKWLPEKQWAYKLCQPTTADQSHVTTASVDDNGYVVLSMLF